MASVFNRPVPADRPPERLGAEGDLAGVDLDVLGRVPEAGPGVLVPGQAGDAGGADDQAVPLRVELAPDIEGVDLAGLVAAVAPRIDAAEALGRGLGRGDGLERGQQARLVGLDLGEQRVAGVAGEFKGFFDSGARRR
jgi:hypothetical protein